MSFIGLGVALSIVFGCLLLALVAELFYLLWWKKRRTAHVTGIETENGNEVKGVLYGVCWETPTSIKSQGNVVMSEQEENNKTDEQDLDLGIDKDLLLKKGFAEEGVEAELMRLHNLAGPPRFLFTIKEETKEDLESQDRSRKGSRTRSLSDVMVAAMDAHNNPIASSPLRCSLDKNTLDSYKNQGFNPLFESSGSEFNMLRSSPPPKFKFLRDAEEKLYRRLMEEAQRKEQKNHGVVVLETEVKGTEQIELQKNLPQFPSSSSQVLPLASSPTTLRPVEKASVVH